MKPIPILGIGLQSKSSNVTAQSRVNCYMDSSDDKNTIVAYGTPGLTIKIDFGSDLIRAMYVCQDLAYLVVGDKVYEVDEVAGQLRSKYIGTVNYSTGFMDISDNGLQIFFTDNGLFAYTFTLATGVFTEVVDADYPKSFGFQSTAYLDSYTLVTTPNTQKVNWSKSYDAMDWDALDFASAESNPDMATRIVTLSGYLYVFGTKSIEVWGSNASGLSRISGLTLNAGLAALQSVAKLSIALAALTTNENGTSQISLIGQGPLKKISTYDIDTIINSLSDITDATAFSYINNSHEFYQINFTAGNKSFLYDVTMDLWSDLKSACCRHYAEKSMKFLNKTYVSDYRSGKLYMLDDNVYTDNGDIQEFELTSKHIFNGLEKVSVRALQIDCETGIGTDRGQGINPQMIIGISKDNGHNYNYSFVPMGKIGEYKARCRRNRLGRSRDWIFRIRITDPVKRVVLGAYVDI